MSIFSLSPLSAIIRIEYYEHGVKFVTQWSFRSVGDIYSNLYRILLFNAHQHLIVTKLQCSLAQAVHSYNTVLAKREDRKKNKPKNLRNISFGKNSKWKDFTFLLMNGIHFLVDLIPNHVQIVHRLKYLICSQNETHRVLNYFPILIFFSVFRLLHVDLNSWFCYTCSLVNTGTNGGKKTSDLASFIQEFSFIWAYV